MILRHLLVENAGPFLGEWEVEFHEGVQAVVGEYEGADDRSNRAGKSWVAVDAPLYALHGFFRGKRVEDFPHRLARGSEDASVTLTVEASTGRRYVIQRGRTASGEPIRRLDGVPVAEADLVEAVRTEILGLSLDEHLHTHAFVQGELHAFMKMTPAERRALISPWFKTDRWVPRAALARYRLTKARREILVLDRERERLEATVADRAEVASELEVAEAAGWEAAEVRAKALRELAAAEPDADQVVGWRERLEALRIRRTALRDEIGDVQRARRAEVSRLERHVALLRDQLAAADDRDARRSRLEALVADMEDLRRQVARAGAESERLAVDLDAARGEHRELRRRYRELRDSRTGSCPVLAEPCDRVARDPGEEERVKVQGLRAVRRVQRLDRDAQERIEARGELAERLESVEAASAELADLRRKVTGEEAAALVNRAEGEWDAAKAKLEVEPEEVEALRVVEAEIEDLQGRLEEPPDLLDLRECERLARIELGAKERVLSEVRRRSARVEEAAERIGELERERAALTRDVEHLAWAAYAFGATGIPSREVENAFGSAEAEMNQVLTHLGTPLRLEFAPTRELREWEPACLACGAAFEKGERTHRCRECDAPRRRKLRDELQLRVREGDAESSFELDSGGGKVLLSLGVRLGLASLPARGRAVRAQHLIVDEPDGMLDAAHRADLHALLRSKVAELGIRQVVLITHADARGEFPHAIVAHRWGDEDRSGVWNA